MDDQVIIAGGGPVGLGLAIDLALRGVRSHVLERSTELHAIPKGQNLTQRTGEHFRAWGISQAVRDASPIPASFGNAGVVAYGKLLGDYSYDWFRRAAVRPYYFADNERLPQYALEHVLRTRAADFPQITFEQGVKVTGLTQDDGGVTLICDTASGARTLRAPYAVGCDGARSAVREAAGIQQDVDQHDRRMALLVFRSMELHRLLERYPGKSIYNVLNPALNGYWQFLGRVDLDGGWFYHAPVPEGTTAENFDFRAYLHQAVGAEFELDFEHIGFWDLRISLAQTYRSGRVFIAGDAAHSHPPYGGYGINTGLEDTRNLSWKLSATLAGWAGDGLLDSYGQERRPVFASTSDDFITRMIRNDREFGERYDPARDKAEFESAWADRISTGDIDVTQFLPNYAGSPIVFGQPGARSSAKGQHSFQAQAGYHLAPQPLSDGRDLWDAMGPGFTLLDLAGSDADVAAFAAAADARGLPLTTISDPSADLRSAYGADLVLVRPDQFVAWTGSAGQADAAAILDRARGAD